MNLKSLFRKFIQKKDKSIDKIVEDKSQTVIDSGYQLIRCYHPLIELFGCSDRVQVNTGSS